MGDGHHHHFGFLLGYQRFQGAGIAQNLQALDGGPGLFGIIIHKPYGF